MKSTLSKYKISILRPAGNDTALVEGLVKKEKKKTINDEIMRLYPGIEQVGFYDYDSINKSARLEMAGGEFCGNALRALAYLILGGQKGEITCRVSGANLPLKAGVNTSKSAYATMPIIKSFSSVEKLKTNLWKVDLEGITYLIQITSKRLGKEKAKSWGINLLKKYDLLYSSPAAGVMFVRQAKSSLQLNVEPVVWVRDINTFFYETACASGTTAIGLWKSIERNEMVTKLSVKQPSGQIINIEVERNENKFIKSVIDGPVMFLEVNL